MLRKLLKSKIHRATVTGADLDYEGSISIDVDLMKEADLAENEAVHVWNVATGARIETYAIPAAPGSGEIRLNGAAARLFQPGDLVIIASFAWVEESERRSHKPKIILAGGDNRVARRIS